MFHRICILALLFSLLACVANAQTLLHHYSFDADCSDATGNANGVLLHEAYVSEGRLHLDTVRMAK